LAWGPCAGKINKILLGMTANPKPLHERHRCRIECRNGTTSIGSDAKPLESVGVSKTAKDSSPFAMSVSCTFSAKRLQNRGIYVCKDVGYEGCWSVAPKKSKTSVLAEAQYLIVNETVIMSNLPPAYLGSGIEPRTFLGRQTSKPKGR